MVALHFLKSHLRL